MLIVGDSDDPHVAAVVKALGAPVPALDARTFASKPLTLTTRGLEVGKGSLNGETRMCIPAGSSVCR